MGWHTLCNVLIGRKGISFWEEAKKTYKID
jgi:hypothetical protein